MILCDTCKHTTFEHFAFHGGCFVCDCLYFSKIDMTKNEILTRLADIDKEINEHILIHHSGGKAGVLKLQSCPIYQEFISEMWGLRSKLSDGFK